MTIYYLELNQGYSLELPKTGIVIESGINNALPVLFLTGQTNFITDRGFAVNFSTEIYYSLTTKLSGKQSIKQDDFSVDETTVASLDVVTLPEGINQFVYSELTQSQLYNYLLNLPLVLPNDDISENKLFANWTLKTL